MVLHTSHLSSFTNTISLSSCQIVPLSHNIPSFHRHLLSLQNSKPDGDSGEILLRHPPLLYQFGGANLIGQICERDSTKESSQNGRNTAPSQTRRKTSKQLQSKQGRKASNSVSSAGTRRQKQETSQHHDNAQSSEPESKFVASLLLPEQADILSPLVAYTPIFSNSLYVSRVFAGTESVWYETVNGEYYGCGRNKFGELGELKQGMCALLLKGTGLRKIAIGRVHSVALLQNGSCFVTGSNLDGQLSSRYCAGMAKNWQNVDDILTHGKWRDYGETTPTEVVDIFATWDSTFFVLKSLDDRASWILLSCGSNRYANLALGYRSDAVYEPGRVAYWPSELQPTKIVAGSQHTLFLDSEGTVWGCGSNADGALASLVSTNEEEHLVLNLQTFDCFDDEKVKDIACGDRHSVFLTEGGRLFICGYNGTHACGIPDKRRVWTPTQVELKHPVERITCGWDFTVVLDSEGTLLACGKASTGALGPTQDEIKNVLDEDQEENSGASGEGAFTTHNVDRKVFPQFRPINFPFHKAKTIDFVGSKNFLVVIKDSTYLMEQERISREERPSEPTMRVLE